MHLVLYHLYTLIYLNYNHSTRVDILHLLVEPSLASLLVSNEIKSRSLYDLAFWMRHMVRDRLELEEKREKDREEAWEKRYELALRKCYKQTIKCILMEIDRRKRFNKRWIVFNKGVVEIYPDVCRIVEFWVLRLSGVL